MNIEYFKNKIFNKDCFNVLPSIPDNSIDMILCDLPYGTTANKWDCKFPLKPLWKYYSRIIKFQGSICLNCCQPFTTTLIHSNLKEFKYCMYWKKTKPSFWQHAKNRPLSIIEDIAIFSKAPMGHISLLKNKRMNFFSQGNIQVLEKRKISKSKHGNILGERPNQVGIQYESLTGYHNNLLEFSSTRDGFHSSQKPVELNAYLIKTFTKPNQPNQIVLDNCMGSGSTLIACLNTQRNYIGIEKDPQIFEIAKKRIQDHKICLKLNFMLKEKTL